MSPSRALWMLVGLAVVLAGGTACPRERSAGTLLTELEQVTVHGGRGRSDGAGEPEKCACRASARNR